MISGTRYRLTLEINRQTQLAREIDRAMTEIATGKRIQSASDDPVGAARVSDIARAQADMASWKRNLQSAAALSTRADDALKAVGANLARVNELMVGAANGTLSAENRATIAMELRSIADDIEATRTARDARGEPLFPPDESLAIPVGQGVQILAVGTSGAVFDVATAAGARDMARIIRDAADALTEPDDALRQGLITTSLTEVGAAVRHAAAAHGEQGARGNRIDNLLQRLEGSALQATEERSGIESADVMEVVARLQSRQLTLQAAQAAFARINASTLFDMLR